jgi:ligand-binding SRPBCC domain-containing protein
MEVIVLETRIVAPPERCFLLSLSIDLHMASTASTGEKAIAGVTHGVIGRGETVTWRGRHFGIMLTHQSLITTYEPPHHFQDVMVRGMFRSFEHDHYFTALEEGFTLMRDELRFAAPFGPIGRLAEIAVLRQYFERFLLARNQHIKHVAEASGEVWRKYLSEAGRTVL